MRRDQNRKVIKSLLVYEIVSFRLISKISAKCQGNDLTITELRHRCFLWKFTRFPWRKFTEKHLHLSFLFFLVLFFKKQTPAEVFSCEFFQNFWQNLFRQTAPGCCFYDFRIHLNRQKHFQSWQQSNQHFDVFILYYGIWTCCHVLD